MSDLIKRIDAFRAINSVADRDNAISHAIIAVSEIPSVQEMSTISAEKSTADEKSQLTQQVTGKLNSAQPEPCEGCKHNSKEWDEEPCDNCSGNHSGYEPCEDAVSRQAVIKAVDRHTQDGDGISYLDEDITVILEEIPSVTPQRKWIPVSERLPDKTGMYHVTVKDHVGNIDTVPCIWEEKLSRWGIYGVEVTAWCKYPEPYREDE